MRALLLVPLLCLAACSAGPGAYGITGPAVPTPPMSPDDATLSQPGAARGSAYGPSMTPDTGNTRYWGYN